MADFYNYCFWYTVWDARTGEVVAAGTSEMCAKKLGYASANSFASVAGHSLSGRNVSQKYNFDREYIDRSEVDSLPPIQHHPRRNDLCRKGV